MKEQTPITAEDYFKLEWGTAFIKATLSERNGLVELSMQDIYSSMEQYAKAKVLEALEEIYSYITTPLSKGDGLFGEKYVKFPKKSEIEKKILEIKDKQK